LATTLWWIAFPGEAMFRGRYEHNVDAKGRLALPAAFKKVLAAQEAEGQLVVTKHLSSPCLVAYPLAEWRAFEARLAEQPQFNPTIMLMRRLYVGGAMDCPLDKLGRLVVPTPLREEAGIEREVFWVGQIKTMEIWTPEAWREHVDAQRPKVGPELLAQLGELGI